MGSLQPVRVFANQPNANPIASRSTIAHKASVCVVTNDSCSLSNSPLLPLCDASRPLHDQERNRSFLIVRSLHQFGLERWIESVKAEHRRVIAASAERDVLREGWPILQTRPLVLVRSGHRLRSLRVLAGFSCSHVRRVRSHGRSGGRTQFPPLRGIAIGEYIAPKICSLLGSRESSASRGIRNRRYRDVEQRCRFFCRDRVNVSWYVRRLFSRLRASRPISCR